MRTTEPGPPPARRRLSTVARRVLVLGGAGVVLVLVATLDVVHGGLLWAVAVAEPFITARPVAGAVLFVVLAALSAMLAFFSSAALVPVAVHAWGLPLSAVLLWVGWFVGGAGAYGIGRYLGRPAVRALASAETLARYEARVSPKTPVGFIVLFQLALPTEVPGYVLGMVRYGFGKYLLALAIAELPFVLGTVFIGESLLERRLHVLLAVGVSGAALSVGALLALRARMRRERAAARAGGAGGSA